MISYHTLNVVGPFYLEYMPGEVEYPIWDVNVSPVVNSQSYLRVRSNSLITL